jgi:hypothetical protein
MYATPTAGTPCRASSLGAAASTVAFDGRIGAAIGDCAAANVLATRQAPATIKDFIADFIVKRPDTKWKRSNETG